ncbi:hypothetical protein ACQB60_14695 [Actinomycetota bacterium Odt1-20B]
MRAIPVAAATLLTATTLALAAPTASAAVAGDNNITSFGFHVSPTTIAAGGQVTLSVDGCEGDAKATSGVFDDVSIPKGQGSATANVFWDAKPGAMYEVTFSCKNSAGNWESGTTDLTIATGRPDNNTVRRGVKAGVGGSIGGFDLQELGLGAALIAGALGTAYYWTRRRSTAEDNS